MGFDCKYGRKQTEKLQGNAVRLLRTIPILRVRGMAGGSLRKRRCLGVVSENQAQSINSSTFLSNGTTRGINPHWEQRAATQGMCAVPLGKLQLPLPRGHTARWGLVPATPLSQGLGSAGNHHSDMPFSQGGKDSLVRPCQAPELLV